MAKKATAKPKKEKSIETILWEAANNLRGGVDAPDYKHVVLGLLFLKFSGDKFEERLSHYRILPSEVDRSNQRCSAFGENAAKGSL